jgi:hypothetical protein
MDAKTARVPRPGTAFPDGCAEGPRRKTIVTLVMNEDREVSCPSCWDCFGILPGSAGTCRKRQREE